MDKPARIDCASKFPSQLPLPVQQTQQPCAALQQAVQGGALRSGSAVPKGNAATGWPTTDGRTITEAGCTASCPLGAHASSGKTVHRPPSPQVP